MFKQQKWTFDVLACVRNYSMLGWFTDHILWFLDLVRRHIILLHRQDQLLNSSHPTPPDDC